MFHRIRQLHISLAAKCQILFGAGVLLVISAALSVPWQRMEQLTAQLNVSAASALADNALSEHVALRSAGLPDVAPALARPASALARPASARATSRPTSRSAAGTSPAARQDESDEEFADDIALPNPVPRLVSLAARRTVTGQQKFERRAISYFARHPNSLFYAAYYDRPDGTRGYRYAKPVYLNPQTCLACHVTAAQPMTRRSTSMPALPGGLLRPAPLEIDPAANDPAWVGIISVDFTSRIDTTQLLLNRAFILIAGLLAGVLAFFTFYFVTTRLILRPVHVLQETAEKVSEGDLNIRSDINSGDEFQQLSETFNGMLVNLKLNADALREVNKSLDLRLGQLAQTNVALYESNRLKSEFLANVSHELRTPLNSILGFADLLKETLPPASEARDAKTMRYLGNIRQSGRNLLDLINDLLDLAKIEAGRMEIRSEPLSLSDLFEGLATILKPLTEPKRVTFDRQVAADVPILHSDPGKLQQVLYNLLSNAIKFSPEGGSITLSAALWGANGSKSADHVRIGVADQGPGIDPAKHTVIFEKFRQLDGSVTRAHSGTGLGLAISKELTTLLGGQIGVDSSPGEGAAFWVVLPLTVPAAQVDVRSRVALS